MTEALVQTPPQVNAKCDVVMKKISAFGTQTDRHTHTHKAKPIYPHYAGCNNKFQIADMLKLQKLIDLRIHGHASHS